MGKLSLYKDCIHDTTVISNRFVDEFMKDANDAQIKIYLYLLRVTGGNLSTSISDIADKFNHTEKDVVRALKYWEKMNLIHLDYDESKNITGIHFEDLTKSTVADIVPMQPKLVSTPVVEDTKKKALSVSKDSKPSYSLDDVKAFKANQDTAQIIFVAETYLGKLLTVNETKSILFIYDTLGFSLELIDFLIEYCVGRGKKEMRYIETVAINWANDQITTVKQAKSRSKKYDKSVYTIMNALGKTLAPTDAEVSFIDTWLKTYGFSVDMITMACQKTVLATDKHRFEYTDGILKSWLNDKITTKEGLKKHEENYAKAKSETQTETKNKPNSNRFNNFKQNTYDFASLENDILSN